MIFLLYGTVLVVVSAIVGGTGLAVLYATSLIVWVWLTGEDLLAPRMRQLAGLTLSTLALLLTSAVALPLLRQIDLLNDFLTTTRPIVQMNFLNSDTTEIVLMNVLTVVAGHVVILLLTVALASRARRRRRSHRDDHSIIGPSSYRARVRRSIPSIDTSAWVCLAPLLSVAFLKAQGDARGLAFMMSGDARNNFLVVMRSRVSLEFQSPFAMLTSGRLGETLASVVSALGNPEQVVAQSDVVAIRSVFVFCASIVAVSVATFLSGSRSPGRSLNSRLGSLLVAATASSMLVSPYPMAEILRSGFFSMFVCLGFGCASISLLWSRRLDSVVQLVPGTIAVLLCVGAYPLGGLVLVPATLFVCADSLLRLSSKRTLIATAIVAGITSAALVPPAGTLMDKFIVRVNDGGAIVPSRMTFSYVMLGCCCLLVVMLRSRVAYPIIGGLLVSLSSSVLIEMIRAVRDASDYGYYGQKVIYLSNSFSWFAFLAILIQVREWHESASRVFRWGKWTSRFRRVDSHLMLGIGTALTAVSVFVFSPVESPVSVIRRGWTTPSETVVERTFELWREGNVSYVFAAYASDSNDRLGNFWSPYFWEPNRWQWTYTGYDTSPEGLCAVLDGGKMTVVTNSIDLPASLRTICPEKTTQLRIEN